MTRYEKFLDQKQREYGEKFDSSELDPRFVPYYNSGERIAIESPGADKLLHGTVGVTTGWRPTFLLMKRRTDRGSADTLGPRDQIVGVKRGHKYLSTQQAVEV